MNRNTPAFPGVIYEEKEIAPTIKKQVPIDTLGLSKRELVAAIVLQGILAGYPTSDTLDSLPTPFYATSKALSYADALLEQTA